MMNAISQYGRTLAQGLAMVATLAGGVATAQAPPVGDGPDAVLEGQDVSSYSHVDGRKLTKLSSWQRDLADAVLAGDVRSAQSQLHDLRSRSAEVNNLYYYLYYRSNPIGNAGSSIMPKFLHKVDQQVTLKMRNGRSYTGIVERVYYNTLYMQTEVMTYSGKEEETTLRVSWYHLAESEQVTLIRQSNVQVDESFWATLDYRNGDVEKAIERLSKQTDYFNRMLLLRINELKERSAKVRVPKMLYSRAPQNRKNAFRRMRVPGPADSALARYMELLVKSQQISGTWSGNTTIDLAIGLCFLADAHHPTSKTYGLSVSTALASINSPSSTMDANTAAAYAQTYGEAYAFTSNSQYRAVFYRAIDALLRQQADNGWFLEGESANMRVTACAAEALVLSYALGYKQEDVVAAMSKLRNAMRAAYSESDRDMRLPERVRWDSKIDDCEFIFLTRLTGDVLHPYVRAAEQKATAGFTAFEPRRYSYYVRNRSHLGEAAAIIGSDAADDFAEHVITPMIEQHNSGAWKTGSSSETNYHRPEHPHVALLVMGLWRYDLRELDSLAKEIKNKGR